MLSLHCYAGFSLVVGSGGYSLVPVLELLIVVSLFCLPFFKEKIIYLFRLCWVFTAFLGLSLVVASGGYSLVVVLGLLIVVASLAVKHRFWGSLTSVAVAPRLYSTGSVVVYSMWDLPGSGIEPLSPASAGRFLTTRPPGKS